MRRPRAMRLSQLTNVDGRTPEDGYFLIYDRGLGRWVPRPLPPHDHDEQYAALDHDHDEVYAPLEHEHDERYAPLEHDHDDRYALIDHEHDEVYATIEHDHPLASETTPGFMSPEDKTKLDGASAVSYISRQGTGGMVSLTSSPQAVPGLDVSLDVGTYFIVAEVAVMDVFDSGGFAVTVTAQIPSVLSGVSTSFPSSSRGSLIATRIVRINTPTDSILSASKSGSGSASVSPVNSRLSIIKLE